MIENWVQSQWRDGSSLWHFFTWPFAQAYFLLSNLKRIYDQRRASGPDVPIIIVGNITVGGAGKSPVVQALCKAYGAKGLKVGVVLRGYKAKGGQAKGGHAKIGQVNGKEARNRVNSQPWPLIVTPEVSVEQCGDEALMHARFFQECQGSFMVVVDPDRVRGAQLLKQHNVDVIISDDGLQHYKLARDFEIVLFNPQDSACHLLPRGPLREPIQRLHTVDAVLSKHGITCEFLEQLPLIEEKVWLYETKMAAPEAPESGAVLSKSSKIVALAGIARPDNFFKALKTQGFHVHCLPFPDHHPFSEDDILALEALKVPLVMTAKDYVKVRPLLEGKPKAFLATIYVVPYEAQLDAAFSHHVLERATAKQQLRSENA